ELLQFGRLEVEHAVSVEQQQGHAFRGREAERIQAPGRIIGLTGESAHQEAVVESGTDRAWGIASDAVQRIKTTGSQQLTRGGQLSTASRTAHRELVNIRERRDLVDQRVTGEERCVAQLRKNVHS